MPRCPVLGIGPSPSRPECPGALLLKLQNAEDSRPERLSKWEEDAEMRRARTESQPLNPKSPAPYSCDCWSYIQKQMSVESDRKIAHLVRQLTKLDEKQRWERERERE